ncbi:MAG: diguanylate cyclase [Clostridium sp.]|nr:diguanylate cyclase [Clostridium sp.]
MIMNLLSSLSSIACVIYLLVGIKAYRTDKKSDLCKIFLSLNLTMAIWSFAYSFVYSASDPISYSIWIKISGIGWCNFTSIILYFALKLSENKIVNNKPLMVIMFIPGLAIFLFYCLKCEPLNPYNHFNSIFNVADFICYSLYLIASFFVLYFWGKNSENALEKKQSKIIIITGSIAFSLNVIIQEFLPLLGIAKNVPNLSQFYFLIVLWGIQYVIANYNFLKISFSNLDDNLFKEIMDLTFLIDLNGKIFKVNKKIDKILGYTESELINIEVVNIVKNDNFKDLILNCSSLKDNVVFNGVDLLTKNKDLIPFDLSVSPLNIGKTHYTMGLLIVGHNMRTLKDLKDTQKKIKVLNHNLLFINSIFREASIKDSLTNLYDHHHIHELLKFETSNYLKLNKDLCIIMLDIDFFKKVNDTYGHIVGDKVISEVSNSIKRNIKPSDYAGRCGGDEFLIILKETSIEETNKIAEAIKNDVSNLTFAQLKLKVTISVGISKCESKNALELLDNADSMLYESKKNGRNTITYNYSIPKMV